MEVDERLRWLEARISSSLKPRGDELRSLFSDEENRAAFLAFCNHSESRRLFVHLPPEGGDGTIRVSSTPPKQLSEKSIFFLKCSHASKLSRECIGEDVVYSECSRLPLEHLEMVMSEVYLPLMGGSSQGVSGDKLLDLIHRLVAATQITRGHTEGKVVLPLPSIEVLAEAATNPSRRAVVIHILESSVVAWMKQVKMVLHLDPNSAILKKHGKYAGPLAELKFWTERLVQLESVRDQLSSVIVLNILHNLEQAHSTYAQAFIHVHRDIYRATTDTELCLMYLSALRPWLLRLHQAFSPDTLIKTFAPLMMTLLLVWQHSGFYSVPPSFHRLLRLLSSEVSVKARDVIGHDILAKPEESLSNLKLALRVCAAFRGSYLDYRERAEAVIRSERESRQGDSEGSSHPLLSSTHSLPHRGHHPASQSSITRSHHSPWPPRNSSIFATLNGTMERCNDLLELVQTVHDFRELEIAAYGAGVPEGEVGVAGSDPLIADIHSDFSTCMMVFQQDPEDLLSLEPECRFEEKFFQFRSTIKSLEHRLSSVLQQTFDQCPTLEAELRVLEMFQGVSKREAVQSRLKDKCDGIVSKLLEEMKAVHYTLSTHLSNPPSHTNVPPTASKLLWLHALRQRVGDPMERVREVAPQLLEGDQGWRLRQDYNNISKSIDSHIAETGSSWSSRIPLGLAKNLRHNVLARGPEGCLVVNLEPTLREVLREAHYLSRPPLNVRLPATVRHLLKTVNVRELGERYTNLEAMVREYNDLREGLSEVDMMLFQHKLQQVDNLFSISLDWTSTDFPDFIAKTRAMIHGDLQAAIDNLHSHTTAIRGITVSWSRLPGLDMFSDGGEGVLGCLEQRHSVLMEELQHCLPPTVERINSHLQKAFQCVDASQESPAWEAYLTHVDGLVLQGLKSVMLTAIGTLTERAHRYEQGAPIPPLVTVSLDLQGRDVQFSPPLSPHSPLHTIPEVVQRWMDSYTSIAKLVRRFAPGSHETCFPAITDDSDIRSAVSKISAHLETNARQCQSLRKRFNIYAFLWEQDVQATFNDFLQGQAAPHPRRFTRPETIRSRASARVESGRPKSSSQSQMITPAPETTLLGVMGVSDWDFLCPPDHTPSPDEDTSKRPSLDDFDGEIAVFQGILERLSKIESVANVGWLCVDQRPAKQALASLGEKWKYVYASYLERQILHVLNSLERFFQEIEPQVEGITGEEEDTQAFMRLMSIFNRVNAQQVEMDTKFGAVHRAMLMLDKFGYPLSMVTREQFTNAPQRWSNLKKRMALGKQRIGPRIQSNGETISRDLLKFGKGFHSLHEQFYSSKCLHHDCLKQEAQELISSFSTKLSGLQREANELIELQELLETNVFNFSLLKEFQDELSALSDVWSISESVLSEHAQWRGGIWVEVDCSELLVAVEKELEAVCSLPPCTHHWDIYVHILQAIEMVQITIPLVEGLRSPAMRARHWKQVLRYATSGHSHLLGRGGTFDPSSLEVLTFGQLLEMELHCNSYETHAIVDRANKDVAIESLLNTFEEVWLSRQLELCPHIGISRQDTFSDLGLETERSSATPKPSARVTSAVRREHLGGRVSGSPEHQHSAPVMLLCNTEGIFDMLESHQTSLQSLVGMVAAASFSEDLNKWQKQLQTVEAVLRVWLQVQALWLRLEEVYSSSEVQQHLSTYFYTFSSVDREWRELMTATAKNPSITTVCLREGLLPSLEKLHSSLQQCQAALVQYMDSQRLRCPWFYFLSLEDILHFVCYGSNLQQLSAQIPKLLPLASRLIYDHELPVASTQRRAGSSRITGVVSQLGERLDLNQSVTCVGPVETILKHLLDSLSSTLQDQLTNVITKYVLKSDTAALSNLPAVWGSSLTTQVTILATQIALEVSLTKATSNQSNLQDLCKEVNSGMATVSQLLHRKISASAGIIIPDVAPPSVQQIESQSYLDSNVALKASASNVQEMESTASSEVLQEQLRDNISFQPRDFVAKLQSVLLVLFAYRQKIEQLHDKTDSDISSSFPWQSMLHFDWSTRDQRCVLSTLNTSIPYGYHYTGSSGKIVLTPDSERSIVFLLQAVQQGTSTLLTGSAGCGKSALVHDLAVSAGQPLFSLNCSPEVSYFTVANYLKGMAATGSWLFLQGIDKLPVAVLQTACTLLLQIQQAKLSQSSSIQWINDTIRINPDSRNTCFASVLVGQSTTSRLPESLLEAFKTCSITMPQRKTFIEALLIMHKFENAAHIANLTATFCDAVEELFNKNLTSHLFGSKENMNRHSRATSLGASHLKAVISLAQRHMREFEGLGMLQSSLHMPSGAYSEISGSTKASLRFRSVVLQHGNMPESAKPAVTQRQSLEELALVLSLKDSLLPSFTPTSREYSILVQLLTDIFPGCDIHGLLAYEESAREGLAAKAAEDKQAVESVRESRAASAMQMIAEEHSSEVATTFEEHIISCCHLHQLTPTPAFQLAVTQLLTLIRSYSIVAVSGPSCSGKTECIRVAADTMREMVGAVTCVTVACNAVEERELMGYQMQSENNENLWQDGLLPQLLMEHSGDNSSKPATKWFILEGKLSSSQLDSLITFLSPESCLKLSNGKAISLNPSHRFILEVPDMSCMMPSTTAKVAKLCLSPDTITWRAVVQKWLHSQSKDHTEDIRAMFEKYIPKCLEFLAPVIRSEQWGLGGSLVDCSPPGLELVPQDLQLSEVHLITSCCAILESLYSTAGSLTALEMERHFIYSAVWSFGGFLSLENKATFDKWWRKSFSLDTELAFPEKGQVWEYYVKPGTPAYIPWSENIPNYNPPADVESAPYVHTIQSVAIVHLISLLIDRGCPVLLNGSSGSGKTSLLLELLRSYCVPGVTEASLLHMYGNSFMTAEVVWKQLERSLEWQWGRNYTSRGCKKLVCFIDDLHNIQSSSPSSCEMVRHQLASGGVYDPQSGKWHSVSDVCYLCTTHSSPGHAPTPQFLKHFTVIQWDGYDSDTLLHIFSTVLNSHLSVQTDQSDSSITPSLIRNVVQAAVQVHEKLKGMFLSAPERSHYLFTLRHISNLFRRLCLHLGHGSGSHDLLLLWQQESWWEYGGVLSSEVDRERYSEAVCHALRKFFSQDDMLPTLLSEQSTCLSPHVVTSLQSKLSHQMDEHNTSHPTMHVNLYQSTTEEVHRLCQHLTSPHDLSHTLLLGYAHPEPSVQLAALHCGFTVVQPSLYFSTRLMGGSNISGMTGESYGVREFRRDLINVYYQAGVKDDKLVLLLTSTELLHDTFLTCLYEFVKDSAISHLFSCEERSRIISAVRSDLTPAGLVFSTETAWRYFIDRVRKNLRVVVALPRLSEVMKNGHEEWREIISSVNIYCHLPWERKQLVDVAMYHLSTPQLLPEGLCESMAHLLAAIHLALRSRGGGRSTNSNYEYFVERFAHELQSAQSTNQERCDSLSSALECVRGASVRIASVEGKLERERVVLEEKVEACQRLLAQIGQDTSISREHSKLVAKQRNRITHLKKVIPDYEHACELAIEGKDHLISSLQQQVVDLNQQSLTELRALHRPPDEIEELLVAVIMIVKSPSADLSWTKGAKRLMANLDRFRELLLECSKSEDNSEVILEALSEQRPSLSQDQLSRHPGGLAAVQLCNWVHGIVRLHTTLQSKLRPLQARVTTMKASLSEYTDKHRQQENKLQVLHDRLEGLSAALESASVEKSRQEEQVNAMTKDLKDTQEFITALSGAHEQWQRELDTSSSAVMHTVGGLALSVTVAVYFSAAPPHVQVEVLNNHLKPVLEERGVQLQWKPADAFLSAIYKPSPQENATLPSNESKVVTSYSQLCLKVLPHMLPEVFVDEWLAKGYSLPQLVPVGLIVSSWNKWPMIYDPDGFAVCWIQQYREEELIILDACDRSARFFLALEQALLNGLPVLIENMTANLDPALQPLVELGHTWTNACRGTKVIKFCGRKLTVHRSFHLYMTTTSLPSSIPTSLATDMAVIDFRASLPLAQELLLPSTIDLLHGSNEYKNTCSSIAACKGRITEMGEQLFEMLCQQRGDEAYWWNAEKIATLVTAKNKVVDELETHLGKLQQLSEIKSQLLPIAHHGALVYSLLQQLSPYYRINWKTFVNVYTTALTQYSSHRQQRLSVSGDTLPGILQAVNTGILQATVSLLDHNTWTRLSTSLNILARCDSCSEAALTIEQLLYLTRGERYQDLSLSNNSIPPNPTYISEELWQTMHRVPLTTEYFRVVIESVHNHSDFWESLQLQREGIKEMPKYPWNRDGYPVTLNDLILLSCINREVTFKTLNEQVSSLIEPITIPLLADVYASAAGEPLVFLHDEKSAVSQANFWHLEDELKRTLQGKTLQVMRFGSGVQEQVTDLLQKPRSDCMLIFNVHCAPLEWLELLAWRTKQALSTGCQVMVTTATNSSLPSNFTHISRVVSLSKVSITLTKKLPKEVWLSGRQSFHHTLQYILASIPDQVLTQCNAIPEKFRPVLFSLAVLHTAVTNNHFCNFLTAIACLISSANTSTMSFPDTLSSLRSQIREIYSLCCSREQLDQLINTCLGDGHSATVSPYGNFQVVMPDSSVTPKHYADHVTGLVQAESEERESYSSTNFVESMEALLLPVLAKLPGVEYEPSGNADQPVNSSKIKEVLEYCLEQVPRPLPIGETGKTAGELEQHLDLCGGLPSVEQYHSYLHHRAITEFNTTVATIHHEAELLLQSAAMEFNGLPLSLAPCLESLLRDEMPQQWMLEGQQVVTLKNGFEGLRQLNSTL